MSEEKEALLNASSRVAFAAFLPMLGELFSRAQSPQASLSQRQKKKNKKKKGKNKRKHKQHPLDPLATAMQALATPFPHLTDHAIAPFSSWNQADDKHSMFSVAQQASVSESFLQQLIAIARHLALGLEQQDFQQEHASQKNKEYRKKQVTLLEQIHINASSAKTEPSSLRYRYALKPLSPEAIFPVLATKYESYKPQQSIQEYPTLWNNFQGALEKIPQSHQQNLSLWLDHFETLCGTYAHSAPITPQKNTLADISLYDHAKTTAALATALWRYHHETNTETVSELDKAWDEKKLLLIQGDFFGIQAFIFANGGASNKKAAKLLRGRSFYVSLLMECAALRLLDALSLPSTSQVLNAAGKFMIIAPNTPHTVTALNRVQRQFDQWFLAQSWGQSGIGLAWEAASCNDFSHHRYRKLITRLYQRLDIVKHQRLNLCDSTTPAPTVFENYLDSINNQQGVCQIDGRSPAITEQDGIWVGQLAEDQINCGRFIVKDELKRLLITRNKLDQRGRQYDLQLDLFGYHIRFTKEKSQGDQFATLAKQHQLLRAWDFSLPESKTAALWNGYARRNINSYVPWFDDPSIDEEKQGKYAGCDDNEFGINRVKSFTHLACEDKQFDGSQWRGNSGLIALKGDIDNLGAMFQGGLETTSIVKMAALSRQINNFFAVYLPWLCKSDERFKNTYTVFAGGDDFFLIGSWQSQINLARQLREDFKRYVAENKQIHFSVGLSMNKPSVPVSYLADMAETSLESAKNHNPKQDKILPKNAVSCFGICMPWDDFVALEQREHVLDRFKTDYGLSTGYIYGLLDLVDMKEAIHDDPTKSIWHAYFAYRTRRLLERDKKLNESQRRTHYQYLAREISAEGIEKYGEAYKVALFTHLYKHRY